MKKNIIRFITAAMTAVTILSATGCGKNKSIEDYTEQDFKTAVDEYNSEQEKKREEHAKEQEAEQEAKEKAMSANLDIVPTEEILEANIFDNKIQIGEKCYTFPITVQEFLDSDSNIVIDETLEKKQLTDYIDGSSSNSKKYYNLCVKYNEYSFQLGTLVPEDKKEKGCTFGETEIQAYGVFELGTEDKPSPFVLAGGITRGSTISDFEQKFNLESVSENSDNSSDNERAISTREYIKSIEEYKNCVQVSYYKDTGEIKSIQYM